MEGLHLFCEDIFEVTHLDIVDVATVHRHFTGLGGSQRRLQIEILALELLVTLAFVAVVRVLILFLELLYVGEGSSALLALAVGCDTWKECRSEIP